MKLIHDALVQSHLLDGNISWAGIYSCSLKKVEIAQKWIIRVIFRRGYRYPDQL